jgi:uncharacterized protein YuzE
MYIERDTRYNLLYVSFTDTLEKGRVASTKELIPGAYFDFDSDGNLLGIEIVNTERVLGVAAKDLHLSGELLGVKEAAELAGKDRANFLRDLASRPDFPEPVARLASGQLWLSRDVESYLRARSSSSDPPAGLVQAQRAAAEEGKTTRLPHHGWEHREGERYRDYRYEDHEQYEDHEVLDTSESAAEGGVPLDDEDHEVRGAERDPQEEQESA